MISCPLSSVRENLALHAEALFAPLERDTNLDVRYAASHVLSGSTPSMPGSFLQHFIKRRRAARAPDER